MRHFCPLPQRMLHAEYSPIVDQQRYEDAATTCVVEVTSVA